MKRSTVSKTWLLTAVTGLGVATLPHVQAQDAGAAPEPEAKPKWETSAGVGLTITGGNSESTLFTADIQTQKKWDRNEIRLGANAGYGKSEDPNTGVDSTNTKFAHGFSQYNRLFPNERTYGYLNIDVLSDDIADVQYRAMVSPGIGHYIIKKERTTLSLELGPAVIFERTGGEIDGDGKSETDEYITLRIAERFEHKFSDRARVWQTLEVLPQVDRFENYLVNAEVGAEAGLTEKLSIRSTLTLAYDNEPAAGRKSNDLKLITSLVYKF